MWPHLQFNPCAPLLPCHSVSRPHTLTTFSGGDMHTTAKVALLAASLFVGTASAALHDRGNGLIYDDVLDVTWLQEANYAATQGYLTPQGRDVANTTGLQPGRMTWDEATAWAAGLSYFDSVRAVTWDDWRLPSVKPRNGISFDYSSNGTTSDIGQVNGYPESELGWMDYQLKSVALLAGKWGPFSVPGGAMWTGSLSQVEYPPGVQAVFAYQFSFSRIATGYQYLAQKDWHYYAWAVRDGDVAAIPEPSSSILFALGGSVLALVLVDKGRAPRSSRT